MNASISFAAAPSVQSPAPAHGRHMDTQHACRCDDKSATTSAAEGADQASAEASSEVPQRDDLETNDQTVETASFATVLTSTETTTEMPGEDELSLLIDTDGNASDQPASEDQLPHADENSGQLGRFSELTRLVTGTEKQLAMMTETSDVPVASDAHQLVVATETGQDASIVSDSMAAMESLEEATGFQRPALSTGLSASVGDTGESTAVNSEAPQIMTASVIAAGPQGNAALNSARAATESQAIDPSSVDVGDETTVSRQVVGSAESSGDAGSSAQSWLDSDASFRHASERQSSTGRQLSAASETEVAGSLDSTSSSSAELSTAATAVRETVNGVRVNGSAEVGSPNALMQLATRLTSHVDAEGRLPARLEVELDPPELGRMSVELTESRQGLLAKITASRESTAVLVDHQLAQLRQTLEESGIEVHEFEVSYDPPQSDAGQHRSQDANNELDDGHVAFEQPSESDAEQNTLNDALKKRLDRAVAGNVNMRV